MANFNDAFQPEAGINFDDLLGIFAGTTDPATIGEVAPVGSLFIRSNGSLFQKTGAGNTEWTQFVSGADVMVKISAADTTAGFLNTKLLVSSNLTKAINSPGANETLTLDLSNVGTAGTYTSVTVDSKGRVTAGSNPGFLTANQNITLSGDVTGSGSTAITTTLNNTTVVAGSYQNADITINSQGRITSATTVLLGTAGTYGSATSVPVFTTDAYGRVTAVTNTAIAFPPVVFPVTSVFGRIGDISAAEGDYSLNQLGDVTLTSPTTGQVLQFNGTAWVNAAAGGVGTVTSVAATGSTGLTIGGSPITSSGTLTFTLDTGLQNLASFAAVGMLTATGIDTWAARTITAPAAGITITNGNGVAGNPTLALVNDLAAVEGLATTGLAVRTGTDTWATRTIQGTTNQITVTNGGGVAGDPTVAIAANPIIPGTGSVQVPAGTTAQRTSPASNGMIRYNSTTSQYEAWVVDKWVGLALYTDGGTFQLNAYLGPIPSTSGTSAVPYDSTEHLVTEGTEIWTRTITPADATSRFVVECPFTVDIGTSNRVLIVSLFRDSVNLGTALFYSTGGGRPITMSLKVNDEPATASAITYSMRAGVGAGSGTWYINATAGGQTLGGKLVSQYEIREFNQ